MTERTIPIASLVLDETIYPRHTISMANVGAIAEAIMAGAEADIPPILIDQGSNRVIDGFHRVRAYERVYGAEYAIRANAKRYSNKQAMLRDAIAANVGRGVDLSRWDHLRCLELADEVGMPINTLAKLLRWQPERLVAYRDSKTGTTLDERKVMLKRSLRHRVGKPLTAAQERVNEDASPLPSLFMINQLISFIETDLLPESEQVAERLHHLCEVGLKWLDEKGANG